MGQPVKTLRSLCEVAGSNPVGGRRFTFLIYLLVGGSTNIRPLLAGGWRILNRAVPNAQIFYQGKNYDENNQRNVFRWQGEEEEE